MKTNHPAHGPVSLNRLLQISEILSKAAAQSDGGNLGYAMADAVKVIDGAIASFGAEPVAWLHSDNGIGIPAITRSRNVADSWFSKGWNIKPLYTTPPASVVPDAISTRQAIAKMENHEPCDSINVAYKYGWNACRAAMLQAGNSPVIGIDLASEPDRSVEVRHFAPPGYVMVPVEPTMAMLDEFDSIIDYGAEDSKDAWSRLIAAAPQQENV